MGISSREPLHARHCHEPDRGHDRRASHTRRTRHSGWLAVYLILVFAGLASADTIRVATFHTSLSRDGPGLVLRDLLGEDQLSEIPEIVAARPDILALQGLDYDLDQQTLTALQRRLERAGHAMPHRFSGTPNSGLQAGFDLDRDGRIGEAEDALGYGDFPGQGGMAILSRFPIEADSVQDFTGLKWRDLPGARLPQTQNESYFSDAEVAALPLHPVSAWAVPIDLPDGTFWVLAGQSTPPVFDGPEDRNGKRNADQARFWNKIVSGETFSGWRLPGPAFAYLGGLNADPFDGEGRSDDFTSLLQNPAVQDIQPKATDAFAEDDPTHAGPHLQDTTRWPRNPGPGNLRVDYILPSADLTISDSGVLRPGLKADPEGFRHFLVWADIVWER